MSMRAGPCFWMSCHCHPFGDQHLFLDPLFWQTHLLSDGAVTVLRHAAVAIEEKRFAAFLADVEASGGWPAGLEHLAHSLTTLGAMHSPAGSWEA